jgi:tRNA (cmo5U34)-methyltransferase
MSPLTPRGGAAPEAPAASAAPEPEPEPLGSWHTREYVAGWLEQDVIGDMLRLPRRISAALVADAGIDVDHVIDLGAGAGPYLKVLLDAFPSARGTWVDSSEPMLESAREQLGGYGTRVRYTIGDAEELAGIETEPADVIVTSRVVHHFSPESIRALYAAALERLRPGGFFFNLDHYGAPGDWEQRYRRIRGQFVGKPRTPLPPHQHDHPFSVPADHLAWLAAAGFEAPDVAWRTFYTALLVGRKPSV